MLSALRKIISFLTVVTTIVVAVRELKVAIEALREHSRKTQSKRAA